MNITISKKVYSVSQITYEIKSILESEFRLISIKGEISNFKKQSSGHLYFSLKDETSQISCAMFKNSTNSLKELPKDGDQVILEGEISVYPPRGNYQLIVRKLEFEGIGSLLLKLQKLKEKLTVKGFFDEKNKKALPFLPKKIGIVTSPTGAVIQDILNVLNRRFDTFHLILNPVKVQGEGAKEEIAKAIDDFNKYNLVDVIIVGRGGGSLEDLFAFNEEIVVEAIFNSKIPIISAVGHETDVSLSDFAADVRAPTPSAAAEIVLKEKSKLIERLLNYKKHILKYTLYSFKNLKLKLSNYIKHPLFSSSYILLGKEMQMLDDMRENLDNSIIQKILKQKEILNIFSKQLSRINPIAKLLNYKLDLKTYEKKIENSYKNYLNLKKNNFLKLISHLKGIDPKNLLKKGYSICFNEKNKKSSIILSIKDVKKDDRISILLSDGKIEGKIL